MIAEIRILWFDLEKLPYPPIEMEDLQAGEFSTAFSDYQSFVFSQILLFKCSPCRPSNTEIEQPAKGRARIEPE